MPRSPSRPPVRLRGGATPGALPPGWPPDVPPPGVEGWERRAADWLLDVCPPDYRGHAVLLRQPRVLARLAVLHASAQLDGARRGTATLRADLAGAVDVRTVEDALAVLESERVRLLAVEAGAVLVEQALAGGRFVPGR